jgi:hypothetical protein
MTHGILVANKIAAMNVDSYNRTAVCASDLDNGNVVVLSAKSTTSGEAEVWTAIEPTTSNGLTGLWMVNSPDSVVVTVSGSNEYKGIDPDPRNFVNIAGKMIDVYKPQLGDIITMTTTSLAGSYVANTTTHINATNSSGGFKLLWGNSQTGSVLSYKFLGVKYFSIGTGAIDSQRIASYEFECVGL